MVTFSSYYYLCQNTTLLYFTSLDFLCSENRIYWSTEAFNVLHEKYVINFNLRKGSCIWTFEVKFKNKILQCLIPICYLHSKQMFFRYFRKLRHESITRTESSYGILCLISLRSYETFKMFEMS